MILELSDLEALFNKEGNKVITKLVTMCLKKAEHVQQYNDSDLSKAWTRAAKALDAVRLPPWGRAMSKGSRETQARHMERIAELELVIEEAASEIGRLTQMSGDTSTSIYQLFGRSDRGPAWRPLRTKDY